VLVFGERDHAVADVAGREDFELFAEAAGGAAVVGDGDYGGELADEAGEVGAGCGGAWMLAALEVQGGDAGSGDVSLKAAQQRG